MIDPWADQSNVRHPENQNNVSVHEVSLRLGNTSLIIIQNSPYTYPLSAHVFYFHLVDMSASVGNFYLGHIPQFTHYGCSTKTIINKKITQPSTCNTLNVPFLVISDIDFRTAFRKTMAKFNVALPQTILIMFDAFDKPKVDSRPSYLSYLKLLSFIDGFELWHHSVLRYFLRFDMSYIPL